MKDDNSYCGAYEIQSTSFYCQKKYRRWYDDWDDLIDASVYIVDDDQITVEISGMDAFDDWHPSTRARCYIDF